MKRREAIGILGAAGVAACAPVPDPDPTPTSTPTPTPLPIYPGVSVKGADFVGPLGNPIWLLGASNCDDKAEWSIYPPREADRIYNHNGNYTHIRLGPFWNEDLDTREYDSAYALVGMRANLEEWNPIFWDRVRKLLSHVSKYTRLFVVEVDLSCRWILERPHLSPWSIQNNIQGIAAGDLNVTQHAPLPVHKKFIRKCVEETGRYPVIYQTGNEAFKGYSAEFEMGILDEVKQACHDFGFPERPVGTNTHDKQIELLSDYATRHHEWAQGRTSYPVMVNEYNEDKVTIDDFRREAQRARGEMTSFHLWRCVRSEAEYEVGLDVIKEILS